MQLKPLKTLVKTIQTKWKKIKLIKIVWNLSDK
jgi:hypothetical protein